MPANNPKLENILNLALDTPERQREKSPELATGFDSETRNWELIVRYSSSLDRIRSLFPDIIITELYGSYAIIHIPQDQIDALAQQPEILYIEKPKRLYFAIEQARRAACISGLNVPPTNLTGRGTLIAILDSGIDYAHPDFRNEDGTTRILRLWDQTLPPTETAPSPAGYNLGAEYTSEMIDLALQQTSEQARRAICPSIDRSGHGTHVTGIAAGNGRASEGRYLGVAPECNLLIVKLGTPEADSFPKTTQLMTAIDYAVKFAASMNLPLAVNISFGNNYGSHSGTSLLETYIDTIADYSRTSIVIGSGNEGASAGHASGSFSRNVQGDYEPQFIDFAVGVYETAFSVQLWKNFADLFDIAIIHPSGNVIGPFQEILGSQNFVVERTQILVYFGEPSPYSVYQELYIDFIPLNDYVDDGIWQIALYPKRIRQGTFDLWMPGSELRGKGTAFLIPSAQTTLTIPSTSNKSITVGAYDSWYDQLAGFSGRGYTWQTNQIAPTLAAPGVDITAAAPDGRYDVKSGTSMAAPFVTGAVSLLMQEGILNGTDSFLYGEKAKAYLIRGARQINAIREYPNPILGWGVLCVRDSLPQ